MTPGMFPSRTSRSRCQPPSRTKSPAVEPLEPRLLLSIALGAPVELDATGLADVQKLIVAGDPKGKPADSPAQRVDPNTTDSPYAGVGSLRVDATDFDGYIYMGSATAISPTHVLTAAHMLDLDDNGSIDVLAENVVFNLNFGGDLTHEIPGSALFVHPDWTGFVNPSVNDDVAVIELSSPLPDGVPIYPLNTDPFEFVETATLVGYGDSGDGVNGYDVKAWWTVKRTGGNLADFYGVDDEGSGARELFEYDFDGRGRKWDFSGRGGLGNDVETTLGGGDSGGPAFIDDGAGNLEIFGVNTYTFGYLQPAPYFGSGGGGIVVAPYVEWIKSVMGLPGVTIEETNSSTDVTEGGNTDTYTIVLDSEPTADVTITVDPDGQLNVGQGAGVATTLTFTAADWNLPQELTVAAVDDALIEGPHTGIIAHTASSDDGNYNGILIDGVTANITDNDQAAEVTVTGVAPDSGDPGHQYIVLVYGSNFQDGAKVRFGKQIAVQKVVVDSSTQLTVAIEIHRRAAAGPRDVTVTNPDGSKGTAIGAFTVTGTSGKGKNAQVVLVPGEIVDGGSSEAERSGAAQADEPAVDILAVSGEVQPAASNSDPQANATYAAAQHFVLAEADADATVSIFELLKGGVNPLDALDEPDLGGVR